MPGKLVSILRYFQDPQYNVAIEEHPNAITKTYIKTVAKFGPIVEVRSGQGTQDLPVFVRFIDKDSEWDYSNGLITLITTLLNFNLVGYGFVLPDMIGGNGYNGAPSEELFTRWLQANTFMPSLQFSYVPWDYSNQTIGISKKFTALHAQYTDAIMEAMQKNVDLGEPVNPPLWWLDPYDRVAWQIDDGRSSCSFYRFRVYLSHLIGTWDLNFNFDSSYVFFFGHRISSGRFDSSGSNCATGCNKTPSLFAAWQMVRSESESKLSWSCVVE